MGIIVPIYKNKGMKTYCGNYRGITLMCVAQEILASILNERLVKWNKNTKQISDWQGAFQKGKAPEEFVLLTKMLLNHGLHMKNKPSREKKIYIVKLYVEKAFDRVWRDGLWARLWNIGIKGKFWRFLRVLYQDTQSSVRIGVAITDPFTLRQGVKQGCALSSPLFTLFMEIIIQDLKATGNGIRTANGTVIPVILYADDVLILAENREDFKQLI